MNTFTKYILLLFLTFEVSSFVSAQNINYKVYSYGYYTGRGNSDFWTSDDPRWIFTVSTDLGGYADWTGVIRSMDNGLDGPAWNYPGDFLCKEGYNVNVTGWKVSLDGWEDDACGPSNTYNTGCANDDEARSTITSGVLNFRSGTNCDYTNYQINAPSYWAIQYKVYWEYAVAPTITSQPSPDDRNVCVGSNTTITVGADAAAKFYQWQVNTTTGTPQSGCPSSGWVNVSSGSGGTTASYTPPQTPGTRLYRCLITSNCSADFSSKTVISNCVRVNYFPYVIPIISGVCGGTTSLGSTVPFSVPVVPAVNAIANASYTWSVSPAGPGISAPTSTSTNITFPALGTYTVTVTVDDNGGPCASQVSASCVVIVNSPDCEYVYVDPGTANTSGGSSNTPVTLAAAIGLLSSTRNHIRMAGGTYNNVPVITLPNSGTGINNVIIEGGYVNTGGVWTKSSAAVTTINFTGTEYIDNNVEHVIGFKLVSTAGTTLQDLTLTTAASSGTTVNGHGKSNYAVYINGAGSYTITRCNISSNNATGGLAGAKGANGTNGNTTYGPGYGGDGGCDYYSGCGFAPGGGAGGGGAGGAGGAGNNGGGVKIGANGSGGNGGAGGAGGAGGPGRCAGENVNGAGQADGNAGGNGSNGTAGSGGALGAGSSAANTAYVGGKGSSGSGGTGSCDNGGCGGNGGGTPGAGAAGSPGGTPGADIYSGGWFQPTAGTNGGGGGGGKGGYGGGGGSGSHDSGTCDRDGGRGGAGGGGGGGGGAGGYGGGGGGASFAMQVEQEQLQIVHLILEQVEQVAVVEQVVSLVPVAVA